MSISENRIDATNVILAKSTEAIDTFFEEGISTDSLILSTGNSTLISMDHSFGAGVGAEQNIILKFVDSGGTTLGSMMSLNISDQIKRSRMGSKESLFLITYGTGSDRRNWSQPTYHYIYKLDFDIMADGLDVTTAFFTPSLSVYELSMPVKAPLSKKNRIVEKEIIGEISDAGLVTLASEDSIVDAFLRLLKKSATRSFGLPVVMKIPKDLITTYLTKTLGNRFESGGDNPDDKAIFGVGELARLSDILPEKKGYTSSSPADFMNFDVAIDDSTDYRVRANVAAANEGEVELDNWAAAEKLNSLLTLLGLTGFTIQKMKSSEALRSGKAELFGMGTAQRAEAKRVEDLSPNLTDSVDIDIATTSMEDVEAPPDNKTHLVLSFSLNYNTRQVGFRSVLRELFSYLRLLTGKKLDYTFYVQNEAPALQKLLDEGHISKKDSTAPVIIFGDLINVINSLGEGAGQIPYRQSETGGDYSYNKTVTSPLFLSTSKNILNVEVNSKLPAVEFFANNTFYSDTVANGKDTDYIEYISSYLKDETERFTPSEDNPYSEDVFEYYDYKRVAKLIWERLKTNDPKAFGQTVLTSESKFGGMLTYLYYYYKYAALGTVFTTIKSIPQFNYSSNALLGQDAFVSVLRNPTPYDHVMDQFWDKNNYPPHKDSFVSGRYRIQGFTHSISNASATSTFYLQKVSLQEVSSSGPELNITPEGEFSLGNSA
tara:strand:- start:692 stop:2836 length:2145 start_codon:yes stop_codon:yes gene_type:complete